MPPQRFCDVYSIHTLKDIERGECQPSRVTRGRVCLSLAPTRYATYGRQHTMGNVRGGRGELAVAERGSFAQRRKGREDGAERLVYGPPLNGRRLNDRSRTRGNARLTRSQFFSPSHSCPGRALLLESHPSFLPPVRRKRQKTGLRKITPSSPQQDQ